METNLFQINQSWTMKYLSYDDLLIVLMFDVFSVIFIFVAMTFMNAKRKNIW